MIRAYYALHDTLWSRLAVLDGLPALAMRLYLVPVFWVAGSQKIANMDATINWFGNPEWGLGLPLSSLLAHLAAYTEVIGALLLLLGLAVRWVSIPLMITMAAAALIVHWDQGWATIADAGAPDISVRLGEARDILREYGNYAWLSEKGPLVILNNGIELAVTYFIMLLALLFSGGGRYVSIDYFLACLFPRDQV